MLEYRCFVSNSTTICIFLFKSASLFEVLLFGSSNLMSLNCIGSRPVRSPRSSWWADFKKSQIWKITNTVFSSQGQGASYNYNKCWMVNISLLLYYIRINLEVSCLLLARIIHGPVSGTINCDMADLVGSQSWTRRSPGKQALFWGMHFSQDCGTRRTERLNALSLYTMVLIQIHLPAAILSYKEK